MIITVVATVCHLLTGSPVDVCKEVIVVQSDQISMLGCQMGQPQIADWKNNSIYKSDEYHISRLRCIPGHYELRNNV